MLQGANQQADRTCPFSVPGIGTACGTVETACGTGYCRQTEVAAARAAEEKRRREEDEEEDAAEEAERQRLAALQRAAEAAAEAKRIQARPGILKTPP